MIAREENFEVAFQWSKFQSKETNDHGELILKTTRTKRLKARCSVFQCRL